MTVPITHYQTHSPTYQLFNLVQEAKAYIEAPFDEKEWLGRSVIVITDLIAKGLTTALLVVTIAEALFELVAIGPCCTIPDKENKYTLVHLLFTTGRMIDQLTSWPKKLEATTLTANIIHTALISHLLVVDLPTFSHLIVSNTSLLASSIVNKPNRIELIEDIKKNLPSLIKTQLSLLFTFVGIELSHIIQSTEDLIPRVLDRYLEGPLNSQDAVLLNESFDAIQPDTQEPSHLLPYVKLALDRIEETKQPYMTEELRDNFRTLTLYQRLLNLIELTVLKESAKIRELESSLIEKFRKLDPIQASLLEQLILEGDDFEVPKILGVDLNRIAPVVASIKEMNLNEVFLENLYAVCTENNIAPLEEVNTALLQAVDLKPFEKRILAFMLYPKPLLLLKKEIIDKSPAITDQSIRSAITLVMNLN